MEPIHKDFAANTTKLVRHISGAIGAHGKSHTENPSPTSATLRKDAGPALVTGAKASQESSLWRDFVAGGLAGLVSETILHPFDVINTRLKVQSLSNQQYINSVHAVKNIWRGEGLRGLYGGLSVTLAVDPPTAALYFGCLEAVQRAGKILLPPEYEGVVQFVAGGASELVCSIFCVPSEVVKRRLQLGRNPSLTTGGRIPRTINYRGISHAVTQICKSEGISGLYCGYKASILTATATSGAHFAIYEQMKAAFIDEESRGMATDTLELLGIGMMAGTISAGITNPLDVVTVRLMTQGTHMEFTGILDCLVKTVAREGHRALWQGVGSRIASLAPNYGLHFAAYETFKSLLGEDS